MRYVPSARFSGTMFVIATWVMAIVCVCTRTGSAQHSDVFFSVESNQIVIQNSINPDSIRTFDVLGDGTVWHGFNPGYSTTGPDFFQVNEEIAFNVVSPLLYSDGTGWDLPQDETYLRQFWPVFPDLEVTASAETGNQPGFLIGAAGLRGTIHQHHTFELANGSRTVPPDGAYAIQQVITADGYETSAPFWIVLNNGLPISDFAATFRQLPTMGIVGDFDRNGELDTRDIDRLQAQILANDGISDLNREFDLSEDGQFSHTDLNLWVRDIKRTWIGDADLDGEFSSTDLVAVFQSGRYDTAEFATWQQGDWNADGIFESGDLVAAFQDGGYEQGPRAASVPEPHRLNGLLLLMTAICSITLRRRVP